MNRSTASHPALIAALLLAFGLTCSATADYQSTPAARGADAVVTVPTMELDKQDLRESFSAESLSTNPALSDADVMAELNMRLVSDDRLEQAAANLAPEAVTEGIEVAQVEADETDADADAATASEDEVATSVASR